MGKSVALLDEWGADLVHCDVMDGDMSPILLLECR